MIHLKAANTIEIKGMAEKREPSSKELDWCAENTGESFFGGSDPMDSIVVHEGAIAEYFERLSETATSSVEPHALTMTPLLL